MNTFFTARLAPLTLASKCGAEENANSPANSLPDEVLLTRLQAGEQEALGCLFQRYARVVHSVAARILRDDTEAEDLVQDLFLFIQRKCAIFDSSKSSASSWIVHMAYQRAIERRRYLATRHFYQREDIQRSVGNVVGNPTAENDYSPEAVFGRNGLKKIVEALSDDQRQILRLHFFEGYTLSAVYHRRYDGIISLFGLSMSDLKRYQASLGVPNTHLLTNESEPDTEKISLPVRFKEEFQLEKTHLLAQVVEKWELLPVGFLQHLDLHKSVYGYIGLEDYTLFPLIRPGSLVQIDASQRKISTERWKTEFDRPVYFVELRNGYVCSWCQLDRGQLMIIPHPHSHQDVRRFDFPSQAEIVGRVTGVAMRIVGEKVPESKEPSSGGSR